MFDWFQLTLPPAPAIFAQLLVGLINGAFYAMLSLGLAVIFGLLNIINFTHGAQYMLGAFCAWFLLNALGLGYWPALILAPIIVGALGIVGYRHLTGARPSFPGRRLRVVETLRLAPRTALFVVEFDRRTLLIGQHGDRLSLLVGSAEVGSARLHGVAEGRDESPG